MEKNVLLREKICRLDEDKQNTGRANQTQTFAQALRSSASTDVPFGGPNKIPGSENITSVVIKPRNGQDPKKAKDEVNRG